jgi:hypothetical protein
MADLTPMNADAEAAMTAFLHGEIRFAEFALRMRHFLDVDFDSPAATIRYRRPLEARVTVGPADLYPVLDSYLAGERDEAELGRWAQALDMMTEFGPAPDASDEEADRLEPMWDVLAQLGGPPFLGRVTPESVRAHLARLRALEAEITPGAT